MENYIFLEFAAKLISGHPCFPLDDPLIPISVLLQLLKIFIFVKSHSRAAEKCKIFARPSTIVCLALNYCLPVHRNGLDLNEVIYETILESLIE
jgi:hypothetical protein